MLIERLRYKFAMAGCFPDLRGRASSFDLHNLEASQKMSILNRLFRSKSDSGLKIGRRSPTDSPSSSPRNSPRGSPGAPPRRRFARVIRDDEAKGEEYVNPHVIRKYNKGYIEQQSMKKSASLDDSHRTLPYTVTGPTILKKHRSMEADSSGSHKHTCFKEDVEIIEFDVKEKCAHIMNEACIMHQRLQDDTMQECIAAELKKSRDASPTMDSSDSGEEDVHHIVACLDLSLDVIDEQKNGELSAESSPENVIDEQKNGELSAESSPENEAPATGTSQSDSGAQLTLKSLTDSEADKRPPPERQSSSESEDEGRSAPKKSKYVDGKEQDSSKYGEQSKDISIATVDYSLLEVES